jgi:hypothetical protein
VSTYVATGVVSDTGSPFAFVSAVALLDDPGSRERGPGAENAQVFDFELSAADMEELDALDRSGATRAALERKWVVSEHDRAHLSGSVDSAS